ncbi:glycosyltransferase family 2 protein [Niveispirillum sp. BGYR6]|uniref:glycosyltransferase family 2 protein n=1 Tax=Niveispirillum sp. BGYR6 TaxID=2971249 RepID=UPI0022B9B1A7|nr:glycosyltransferase family 2 protein [Niveispirillum sp. BGYR6]MDG5496499.1 glycosyltransferase family 2 protein [Niveispirillum sp. BGYR6]
MTVASVSSMAEAPLCWIVLLNWNGHADTIACIDSVMSLKEARWRLVVCDNASSDGSASILWQAMRQRFGTAFQVLSEADASATPIAPDTRAFLIQNTANHGYAGGNNVGIRLALRDPAMAAIWILNNDTEVDSNALAALWHHAEAHPRQGIIGSTLLYHDRPDVIQAAGGGTYHRWTGLCDHHGYGEPREAAQRHANRPLDYVFGAAMFIRRPWLEQVGLMDESLFLYFEEIDYCRAGRSRFEIGYCPNAIVFHKEGGSTGGKRQAVSLLADFYNLRNRLRITWRHFPYALPTVWAGLLVTMLNRWRRGQRDRVAMVLRIAFGFRHIEFKDLER